MPCASAYKTTQNKKRKYANLAGTRIFYPFAVETPCTWHDMAIELTQEIGRRITAITEDSRETTFIFQRLSIALQRGNAVSFYNATATICLVWLLFLRPAVLCRWAIVSGVVVIVVVVVVVVVAVVVVVVA